LQWWCQLYAHAETDTETQTDKYTLRHTDTDTHALTKKWHRSAVRYRERRLADSSRY